MWYASLAVHTDVFPRPAKLAVYIILNAYIVVLCVLTLLDIFKLDWKPKHTQQVLYLFFISSSILTIPLANVNGYFLISAVWVDERSTLIQVLSCVFMCIYVATLIVFYLSIGLDNFSLRSVKLISSHCYGVQIITVLAAYIFGQLSYKLAYRIVYTALIFLAWLLQFVFPDFNAIHMVPVRSGLLSMIAVVTGIKALGNMSEKITWYIGGAVGVTIFFVHRIMLRIKLECVIRLLMLQRKYKQHVERNKDFDIDYVFPFWKLTTTVLVVALKLLALPFYMVDMAVTKMRLKRLTIICDKLRRAMLTSRKVQKFKCISQIPTWNIRRKMYLTPSDKVVLRDFEKLLKKREKYCENVNVLKPKNLERLAKIAFWSPADYTLITEFIAMQYINFSQGFYVLGLQEYDIFSNPIDIQYLKYLEILVQSKFPNSVSISLTYASVLLRVLEDYASARHEMVADQIETFTRAFNTYFTLNKELISQLYGVTHQEQLKHIQYHVNRPFHFYATKVLD